MNYRYELQYMIDGLYGWRPIGHDDDYRRLENEVLELFDLFHRLKFRIIEKKTGKVVWPGKAAPKKSGRILVGGKAA